jgi:hypothetical protein
VDQRLVEVQDQELLLGVCVREGVPVGSGSFTFFLLMYSCDGPFRLFSE